MDLRHLEVESGLTRNKRGKSFVLQLQIESGILHPRRQTVADGHHDGLTGRWLELWRRRDSHR